MLEGYKDVLSIDDVCEIFGLGRNKVYEMLRDNEIPNRKIHHKYIVPKQGIINYLYSISEMTNN